MKTPNPSYFSYSPNEMTQAEAYEAARYFLAFDSVVMVTPNVVMGRHYQGEVPTVPQGRVLVRVHADGSQQVVNQ